MKLTIEDLSKHTDISADDLTELIKDNFGDRSGLGEIAKDTEIENFPEHLQSQIGLTAWAFSRLDDTNLPK